MQEGIPYVFTPFELERENLAKEYVTEKRKNTTGSNPRFKKRMHIDPDPEYENMKKKLEEHDNCIDKMIERSNAHGEDLDQIYDTIDNFKGTLLSQSKQLFEEKERLMSVFLLGMQTKVTEIHQLITSKNAEIRELSDSNSSIPSFEKSLECGVNLKTLVYCIKNDVSIEKIEENDTYLVLKTKAIALLMTLLKKKNPALKLLKTTASSVLIQTQCDIKEVIKIQSEDSKKKKLCYFAIKKDTFDNFNFM